MKRIAIVFALVLSLAAPAASEASDSLTVAEQKAKTQRALVTANLVLLPLALAAAVFAGISMARLNAASD